MCGIAAILSSKLSEDGLRTALQSMNDSQEHRGPDAEGLELTSDGSMLVGLGHRRLSIIDLQGGKQPMCNEDGSVWITYNGEIYNHLALRAELESLGHQYRTLSDTETIIHAYEQWGAQALNRLRGMFAFAIWDAPKKRLFAARDRVGIKPFYYATFPGTFICSSEIKGILAAGIYSPEMDVEALPEMMTFGYLAGENTLLSGVRKLPPGHWLVWKQGSCCTGQYWEVPLPDSAESCSQSDEEWVRQFRTLFEESVRIRLMSDVPLGVFLSGGIDSSAIAAVMAKEMSEPLKTFSVGFESGYYSEFEYAREVAAALGTEHHEIELSADDTICSLPRLIWHEDEPLRSAASTALHWVSQLAREHVTVVLTGEGSDELFAGYDRYWATLFNQKWGKLYNRVIPCRIREGLISPSIWKWPLPASIKSKISHTFLYHSLRPEEIIFDNFYAIFPKAIHNELFADETNRAVRDIDPYSATMRFFHHRQNSDRLDQLLYTDQKTYLVDLLMKQDAMSMAASIESRVPFLDHELVQLAARVPQHLKLGRQGGKHLVKEALGTALPRSISARKKMGFPVPVEQWLRQGFGRNVRDVLTSERAKDRGLFVPSFIEKMLVQHQEGARNYTDQLWALLNLELWARVFIDDGGHEAASDEIAAMVRGQGSNSASAA